MHDPSSLLGLGGTPLPTRHRSPVAAGLLPGLGLSCQLSARAIALSMHMIKPR